MSATTVFEAAAPPCHQCGAPIKRLEQVWANESEHPDGTGERTWRLRMRVVCGAGHSTELEPFDDLEPA